MDFENKYPYTDFHELNLDWILNQMKTLAAAWDAYQEQLTGPNGEWPTFKSYIETSWATYQANLTGPTGEWPTFKAAMELAWQQYQDSLTGVGGEWPTFKATMEGEWQQFFDTYLQTLGVVQIPGSSVTDVMSQKATTDLVNAAYPINIDYGTLVSGEFVGADGAFFSDVNSKRSNLIPIKPNTTIKAINVTGRGGRACCTYDKNQQFIEVMYTGTGDQTVFTFKTSYNAYYFAFSALSDQTPVLYTIDEAADRFNNIETFDDRIYDSIYNKENYFVGIEHTVNKEPTRMYVYYTVPYHTNGIKIVNGSTKYATSSAYRINGGTWTYLHAGWNPPGTNEYADVSQYDEFRIAYKKLDDTNFTTSEYDECLSQTTVYFGLKSAGGLLTYYVSTLGNDDNDGLTPSTAFATVDKALSKNGSCIYILEGVYNQQIDLSKASQSDIEIKNATYNGKVIFMLDENVIASSETQLSGYNNVYYFTTDKTFITGNKWIFQQGIPDSETEITQAERNALERGYQFRCEDTKITLCSSNNLADALTEIENATTYKWYNDNGTIYYSRPSAVDSTNPICASFGKSLFINTTGRKYNLTVCGIESKYLCFGLIELNGANIVDCRSGNNFGGGSFVYDRTLDAKFIRCEAYRTFTQLTGDGFNGHSNNSGDIYSKQTTCTMMDCWSHDNNDDGYSDHERSEITIIGGLYEYNGKAGVTPSYGSHCTCYNVYSRNNYCGFAYVGEVDPAEGGMHGQMTCFNCVAENNTRGGRRAGFEVNGAYNSVLLVDCKSIGHTGYGYYAHESTTLMTLIDCSSLNDTTVKGGSGTITIKNTTLVS